MTADRPCSAAVRDDRRPDQALGGEPPHLAPVPRSSSGQLPLPLQIKGGASISWLLGVDLGLQPVGKTGSGQEARKEKDRV